MDILTDKPYRIFAEAVEHGALNQFESALKQSFAVRGALMPDAHTGYALPIGAVVAAAGVIVPAWVGYDIGCGMCALPTTHEAGEVRRNAKAIFDSIYQEIPVGFEHNRRDTPWKEEKSLPRSKMLNDIFGKNGLRQLGSLGSGNHFIEIGVDGNECVWVIIHSGSRNIGHSVASHYMRLASPDGKPREDHLPLDMDSRHGKDYIADMNFCLAFALQNRLEMMRRILRVTERLCRGEGVWPELINRNHNHAEQKGGLWIHRKGATHAEAGMMGVIPGNMRDGSFIVRGKGNPDSLWSSSHGAGRVLGRKEAKRQLNVADFRRAMSGVVARVDNATLDEAPFAYKNVFDVMEQQSDLVEVVAHVRPMVNIKG